MSTDFINVREVVLLSNTLFRLLGKNISVSADVHPKPMSSTQGIESLKALGISINVLTAPPLPSSHTHLHTLVYLMISVEGYGDERKVRTSNRFIHVDDKALLKCHF